MIGGAVYSIDPVLHRLAAEWPYLVAIVLAVAAFHWLERGLPARENGRRWSTVDLQRDGSTAGIERAVAAWKPAHLNRVHAIYAADVALILAYAGFGYEFLATRPGDVHPAWLVWLPVAAAAFDALEDALQVYMIHRGPAPALASASRAATAVKWALLALFGAAVVFVIFLTAHQPA